MNLIEKLELHNSLKLQLDRIKKQEADLRKEICDELLKGKYPGTHHFSYHTDSGLTFNVKATKSVNYSIDEDIFAELVENGELTDDELDCIITKHSLSVSKYNKLQDVEMLDECITTKDAMPTLSIEIV